MGGGCFHFAAYSRILMNYSHFWFQYIPVYSKVRLFNEIRGLLYGLYGEWDPNAKCYSSDPIGQAGESAQAQSAPALFCFSGKWQGQCWEPCHQIAAASGPQDTSPIPSPSELLGCSCTSKPGLRDRMPTLF